MTLSEWVKLVFIPIEEKTLIPIDGQHSLDFIEMHNHYTYPKIICNDGFEISIQGGLGIYSDPQRKSETYKTMELGFPTEDDELISISDEVRGYVPVSEIQEMLDRHNDIDIDKSFENVTSERVKKYMINRNLNIEINI